MGKKGGGRLENADLKVWTFHTLPCDNAVWMSPWLPIARMRDAIPHVTALKIQSDDYKGDISA